MSWMSKQITEKDVKYYPVNKEKYMGKTPFAVCRSSWEVAVCRWLDSNQGVLQWKSEPFGIPYVDPSTRDKRNLPKRRQYYPDFIAKIRSNGGQITIWLIEVKPAKETVPPKKGNKSKKTQIYEAKTWVTNQAKWKYTKAYCERRNWKFKILTEKELLI